MQHGGKAIKLYVCFRRIDRKLGCGCGPERLNLNRNEHVAWYYWRGRGEEDRSNVCIDVASSRLDLPLPLPPSRHRSQNLGFLIPWSKRTNERLPKRESKCVVRRCWVELVVMY